VCTRAARKENPNPNPNPNSHDHCLLSKWKCRTCAHTHLQLDKSRAKKFTADLEVKTTDRD